jgi:hypothetical protein
VTWVITIGGIGKLVVVVVTEPVPVSVDTVRCFVVVKTRVTALSLAEMVECTVSIILLTFTDGLVTLALTLVLVLALALVRTPRFLFVATVGSCSALLPIGALGSVTGCSLTAACAVVVVANLREDVVIFRLGGIVVGVFDDVYGCLWITYVEVCGCAGGVDIKFKYIKDDEYKTARVGDTCTHIHIFVNDPKL